MKKRFIFEIDINDGDIKMIAISKNLSIEQVTDEIIASCFQDDLIGYYGDDGGVSVLPLPNLTQAVP